MILEGHIPSASSDPMTIGHEATGQVVRVGSEVKGFRKGDYIGFINAYHACFQCRGCQSHYVYCTSGKMRMQGISADGYLQEYCAIDPGSAIVLPEGMDPSLSSPFFCAGITAYQAVLAARLTPDNWLAIVGCGGLGQLAIRYAKAMNHRVIAIDVDDAALRTAKDSSGADHVFNSRTQKDYVRRILKLTGGGCDAAGVFASVKAAYDSATQLIRVGGNLVCVGIPNRSIAFNPFELTMMKYHVLAANNAANPERLKECVEFTARHGIYCPSRFFRLDQINEMMEMMRKEETGGFRLVVKFDEGRAASKM